MNDVEDRIRRLNELTLQAGRRRLSEQTGYIHYAYHSLEGEVQYPIPTLENVLYALALLASKSSENMLEARTRIDRLLFFQNLHDPFQAGNFPVYLHDYPNCRDAFVGVQLLAPFYWILKNYGAILGREVRDRLEKASILLLEHCNKILEHKKVADASGIKIAAAQWAFGAFLQKEKWIQQGKERLAFYLEHPFSVSWFIPASIAEMCAALQMVYANFADSPWKIFWDHLANTWDFSCSVYVGPGICEFQEGYEPQTTLYDLYLGYFSGHFSPRSLRDHPCHFQAVLIQPTPHLLSETPLPISCIQGQGKPFCWNKEVSPRYASAYFQNSEAQSIVKKEFYPLKIVWGKDKAHTFVCQGGSAEHIQCEKISDEFELIFHFNTPFVNEEREKSREIAFYFDYDEAMRILVNSQPSTTFQLGETVQWVGDGMDFSLSASVIQGEGRFFGHIMRGNRPSQEWIMGKQRFNSYDWIVFLRTLSRSDQCQVRVKISL